MANILVLGCGLVGRTIVKDLAKNHKVAVVDISKENLEEVRKFVSVDTYIGSVDDKNFLSEIVKNFDLVVSAVPGFLGFRVLKSVIEFGKNVVDIAFFPENPFELDELAKQNNVTAIVDCGIAPGLSHMIIGYYSSFADIEEATIYVGGLPFERTLPFEYKAPFSPVDVLEEYIRPARFLHNGKIIQREPLTELELLNFKGIGTLEAFLTDGLRTLLSTVNVPYLKEKTLRYPGYAQKIKLLKDCGFLSTEPIETKSGNVVPMHITEKLLLSQWKLSPEDEEFTIMRIVLKEKNTKKKTIYEIFDRTDTVGKDYSMGRTTGFVACAVVNLLAKDKVVRKGIIPPEVLARDKDCFDFTINYLKERKVQIQVCEE
ncbi:saccharopine dehydrogenase [Bacteroidetes/Chlorobi group bacterium Naka2016]|jgi:saccharopine dehydrogenase-like NADP-dependent oxidoreductase|nr:MAG: saccharopine dehydrogenase [Bacteroidetes/Chlorobi group bacterium Naka2016]